MSLKSFCSYPHVSRKVFVYCFFYLNNLCVDSLRLTGIGMEPAHASPGKGAWQLMCCRWRLEIQIANAQRRRLRYRHRCSLFCATRSTVAAPSDFFLSVRRD